MNKTLVFKGGTVLDHCCLEQFRFSENLDFSSNQNTLPLLEVRGIFTDSDFLTIKKDDQSNATIKIEKLQFSGPLGCPNMLKIEIDYLLNVFLKPRSLRYQIDWVLDFIVQVMDEREICAEKIRAMSVRAC